MTSPRFRPLLVGNWKMHLGESSAKALVATLTGILPFDRVDVVVAPPFPILRAVLDVAAGTPLVVGAQNMHWEAHGAFTGEVAAPMLAELGVGFVILGHSERRALFGETDDTVSLKVAAARRARLAPIVCVGEPETERDAGRTQDVIVAQLRAALRSAPVDAPDGLVVAYEPVWAIGTGRTPGLSEITEAHGAIRTALTDRFGPSASAVRIVYGGSVTQANAASLLSAPLVDGALVGGASLSAPAFASIAAAAGSC